MEIILPVTLHWLSARITQTQSHRLIKTVNCAAIVLDIEGNIQLGPLVTRQS